jgi:alcohol dehydrogenase class IV
VSDNNIKEHGLLNDVQNQLKRSGAFYSEYIFSLSGEPSSDVVRKAVDYARGNSFDLLIGIGGGSILDLTKIMSIMSSNIGDIKDYCVTPTDNETEKVKNYGQDTILIPTTSGTGAEVTNAAVFIENKIKYWISSNKLLPKVSLVDPMLTLTLPRNVTRDTGLEALGNLIEGSISNYSNPISDGIIQQGVHLIYKYLPRAYENGTDNSARTAMSLAALMGGWVVDFPWSSVPTVGHCISEIIGPKFNLPHGLCTGLMLPHAIDFNLPYIGNKLRLILEAFGIDSHEMDNSQVGKEVIKRIVEMIQNMNLPIALKDIVDIPKSELMGIHKFILGERQYLYELPKFSPRRLNEKNLTVLLSDLWDGHFHYTGL